ncbi:MAG: hypothetical protein IPF66_04980 [Holophagales bacterium]|nr:hypothetical protein [Holophagales bacterium]
MSAIRLALSTSETKRRNPRWRTRAKDHPPLPQECVERLIPAVAPLPHRFNAS